MKQRILISGGGVAGLSLANLINKSKFDVDIVEKGPSYMNMGFSIILWQTGHSILSKVIGSKQTANITSPLDSFSIWGGKKMKPLLTTATKKEAFSVHRKDLMDSLATATNKAKGVNVKFNTYIKEIRVTNGVNEVHFSNNSIATYDLVVLGDGVNSYLRDQFFEVYKHSGPYKIVYSWIEGKSGLEKEAVIGFMKNYVYLLQTVKDKTLLAYYSQADHADDTHFKQALQQKLIKTNNASFEYKEPETNFTATNIRVKKPFRNSIALIGDAYHGHTPTLALGTSMALEDSWELSRLLNNGPDDFSQSLTRYTKSRHKRINEAYDFQATVEKAAIGKSALKINATYVFALLGGKYMFEKWVRRLVSRKIE